jgi:hypothetical protein
LWRVAPYSAQTPGPAAIEDVVRPLRELLTFVLLRRSPSGWRSESAVRHVSLVAPSAPGVAAAIPVAILSPPAGVLAGIGAVAFVIALTQAKTYWLMYGLFTFSLVLLLATPGHVGFEAEERGVQILVGIGLLVVGLAIIHALAARVAKRDPQPELAA